jgi:hypothetical protein
LVICCILLFSLDRRQAGDLLVREGGATLAPNLPDKVEAAYRRGDLIEKRKVLMQVWADYCDTIPAAANVAQLRRVG